MSSMDFTYLCAFAQKDGLPGARSEAVAAQAGAYVGACMGGKAKPQDLLPQERKVLGAKASFEVIRAWVKGLHEGKAADDRLKAARAAAKRAITNNVKGVNGNKSSNW